MHTRIILGLCLQLAAFTSQAGGSDLSPSKVFEVASPSIVIVQARDKSGAVIEMGSGVVVSDGVVVSNCHVFTTPGSDTATILYNQKRLPAALLNSDTGHDLCSFTVQGLAAPPVKLGTTSQLKVGEQAFAIGAPEGLELTLSGGLISSLRSIPGGVVLQVTTPISPGSSGGGLFDGQARLIGITSYYMKEGQQLNFALPVEWIKELPQRGRIARKSESPGISGGAPAVAVTNTDFQKGRQALLAGDYAAAAAILGPLATQGDAGAQFDVAYMYQAGGGVPQNYAEAAKWYRLAAQQGYADAQYNLGALYLTGQGVPQDYTEAVKWFRAAASQGFASAQSNLGAMYSTGHGVPQNDAEAVKWFRLAAQQGNAIAQANLGEKYYNGSGVSQDYAEAVKWFRIAAQQGSAVAKRDLGTAYYTGNGVPKTSAQAAIWFNKAATQGDSGAQAALAYMYESGEGVRKDLPKALAWYDKAAQQGNASAQYKLGVFHMFGTGVPMDYAEAVKWFRLAAQQGEADAQTNLGVMYQLGESVEQDKVAAYALYNLGSVSTDDQQRASTNRNKLMESMTPTQIQTGQELTRRMQDTGVLKALDAYLNGSEP